MKGQGSFFLLLPLFLQTQGIGPSSFLEVPGKLFPSQNPSKFSWDWENGHCSRVTHPPQTPPQSLASLPVGWALPPSPLLGSLLAPQECHRFLADLPVPGCANSTHWGRRKRPAGAACPDHSSISCSIKKYMFLSLFDFCIYLAKGRLGLISTLQTSIITIYCCMFIYHPAEWL